MEAWERRPNETDPAFVAFQTYLELKPRSFIGVAQELRKSGALVRRWAEKYDWQERARAWDNSILQRTHDEISAALGAEMLRQWRQSIELQELSFEALIDLLKKKRGSVKSLTELYNSAAERQWALAERAGTDTDNEIKIIIEDAANENNRES